VNVAGAADGPASTDAPQQITDGLYTLGIEMTGIKRGHATGVVVLQDGRIMGGDSFFYYTGSYSYQRGKLRGEMIVHQHTDAPPGLNLVFQRREVTCGFTGTYSGDGAEFDATALAGKRSFSIQVGLPAASRRLNENDAAEIKSGRFAATCWTR